MHILEFPPEILAKICFHVVDFPIPQHSLPSLEPSHTLSSDAETTSSLANGSRNESSAHRKEGGRKRDEAETTDDPPIESIRNLVHLGATCKTLHNFLDSNTPIWKRIHEAWQPYWILTSNQPANTTSWKSQVIQQAYWFLRCQRSIEALFEKVCLDSSSSSSIHDDEDEVQVRGGLFEALMGFSCRLADAVQDEDVEYHENDDEEQVEGWGMFWDRKRGVGDCELVVRFLERECGQRMAAPTERAGDEGGAGWLVVKEE
ncbi:hypothetical protein HDV05_002616 [Chytridiales sp. JEL 0842]|nr:hypothetical protein HDV05_002616 [Chytridiales sp. JEL 0842]